MNSPSNFITERLLCSTELSLWLQRLLKGRIGSKWEDLSLSKDTGAPLGRCQLFVRESSRCFTTVG